MVNKCIFEEIDVILDQSFSIYLNTDEYVQYIWDFLEAQFHQPLKKVDLFHKRCNISNEKIDQNHIQGHLRSTSPNVEPTNLGLLLKWQKNKSSVKSVLRQCTKMYTLKSRMYSSRSLITSSFEARHTSGKSVKKTQFFHLYLFFSKLLWSSLPISS